MHLLAPFNEQNLKDIFRTDPKFNPILLGDALHHDSWNNHVIDVKLGTNIFLNRNFKKCPEIPASCPYFDDISTFSDATTDLQKITVFWKFLTFFWSFLINLTSFNSSEVICF